MTIDKIEEIIQNANADYWTKPAKEIYKLHLEDKIKLLSGISSDEYWTDKLVELEQELKSLENEIN